MLLVIFPETDRFVKEPVLCVVLPIGVLSRELALVAPRTVVPVLVKLVNFPVELVVFPIGVESKELALVDPNVVIPVPLNTVK